MEDYGPALLVFAVVGYITRRRIANRTRFRADIVPWEQNVFESAALGLALFVIVRVIVFCFVPWAIRRPFVGAPLASLWASAQPIERCVKDALPFRFSGSWIAALVLGFGGGAISNLWWKPPAEVWRAVQALGGDLKIFLHQVAREGAPVSLTMKNRKVYVGFVVAAPGLREPSYVTILPTKSGYRDEATLRVSFTTPYEHVYEDLGKRQAAGEALEVVLASFSMILPLENIESANRYDNEVYARYFAAAPKQA